jgi:hypothetical protein
MVSRDAGPAGAGCRAGGYGYHACARGAGPRTNPDKRPGQNRLPRPAGAAGVAVVPSIVATGMDSPGPDPGQEYFDASTRLSGILDDHDRFTIGAAARRRRGMRRRRGRHRRRAGS